MKKKTLTPAQALEAAERAARREALELSMLAHIKAGKLQDGMVREHRFHDTRAWRFDFAWPGRRVALEVEGGTRSGGRHTRPQGFEDDAEKYNEAALLGWLVLRVTGAQVKSGKALAWVTQLLSSPPLTVKNR
jgi:very-short-patch-repair endonuclease